MACLRPELITWLCILSCTICLKSICLPVWQISQIISFYLLPQALGYIRGLKKVVIPDVIEREIVRDDGTMVQRFV